MKIKVKYVFCGLAWSTGLTLDIRSQKTGRMNLHKHHDRFTFQMELTQINNPRDPSGLFAYLLDWRLKSRHESVSTAETR